MTAISPIQDTQSATLQELREWFDSYCAALPDNDKNLIGTAWSLAQEHYPADAATPYGEPLPDHFLGAAQMVDELDLLPDAVAATLLADIGRYVPDWNLLVSERCNSTVAELVKGVDEVQKLTHFARVDSLATPEERAQQAETMRKMLLAMVTDIRVVLIKLAMRTRTLQFLSNAPDSPEKRAVAKETLDIFAPLANRLGVWQLKWQLEDLGFRHQEPEKYREIALLLDEKRTERLEYIENFLDILRTELKNTISTLKSPAVRNTSTPFTKNGEEKTQLRRPVRHPRRADSGRYRPRVLHHAGHRPQPLAAHSRRVRRLHRQPQRQRL
ncbi:GTP pyrophosphokinase [Neisseria gonorrhoeae]|uniref:GTP pyrophosphokinase n=1 Tax=Neisseria gonorrhoeae TaxID=485 RepID=A0A378VTN2_NEIGO|nr:GTP pyrophosphokinase [Neisseria gonorrhoeae]